MEIPAGTRAVLNRLRERGYEAYAVGGCVRDSLLGMVPGDWDICTAALPKETEACFTDCRVIETGLKHGTVTVLWEGESFEITTFRTDGNYVNHRRPEQVTFVPSLREDLLRRDFTINAMAAGPEGEILDFFGGREDLKNGVIRCVGDPDQRFREDALRILRAMRFAARLGFSVEPETAAAMERNRELLRDISGERIYQELCGILTGPDASGVLERFRMVLRTVLPEIGPSMGFEQHSRYHDKDVWNHTLEALGKSEPDLLIRWTLLLHDLGKPDVFTLDDSGKGHFIGHADRSAELAREIFARLHVDRATAETVCTMVRYHEGIPPVEKKHVRHWIGRLGPEVLLKLLEVKRADTLAHVDTAESRARYRDILAFTELTRQVLREEPCFTVRDLAVNGRDLLDQGIPAGPEVGAWLDRMLEWVQEDCCPNERKALLMRLADRREKEGDLHAH